MKPLLSLLLFSIAAITLYAQKTTPISGVVIGAATSKPIFIAWVKARGTKYATATREDGSFIIRSKVNGALHISHLHYKPQRIKLNGVREVTIKLTPKKI